MLSFRLNTDQTVTAGPDHPIRVAHDLLTCEPTPYLHVRAGAGAAAVEARIGRAVYYELVALAVPGTIRGRRVLGVWSCGTFFSLGDLPPRRGLSALHAGRTARPAGRAGRDSCRWTVPSRPDALAAPATSDDMADLPSKARSSPRPCWCRSSTAPHPASC